MRPRKFIRALYLLGIQTIFTSLVLAQEIQTDFNSDGKSDFASVKVEDTGALAWQFSGVDAATGQGTTVGTLGEVGQHIILARWRGRAVPEIGVLSLSQDGTKLLWTIVDENGTQVVKQFGEAGDIAFSGGDFDGNGFADAAVATVSSGHVTWKVWHDPFNGVPDTSIKQFTFGNSKETLFYANPDGSADWVGRIAKSGKKGVVRLRNVVTGEVKLIKGFPSFAASNVKPRPFPIRGLDGKDVLAFEYTKNGTTKYQFANMSGAEFYSKSYPGTPVSVVGEFATSSGEELGVNLSTSFRVLNPFSRKAVKYPRKSGIPVDFININLLGSTGGGGNSGGNNGGNDGGNNGGGDDGGSIPVGEVTSCGKTLSWPGSHIYKTIGSNHFSPTDVRRNTIGVVVRPGGSGPFPGCIQAIDKNGGVIASLGIYSRGGGWAARYYAGFGCGGTTPFNGSKVASVARQRTGTSQIFLKFDSVCYGPIDANRCVGSSQC